jgi:Ca2+/Na+ antiporter
MMFIFIAAVFLLMSLTLLLEDGFNIWMVTICIFCAGFLWYILVFQRKQQVLKEAEDKYPFED